MCAKSLQSCLTLCNPMDCSPPGPSVHGIIQARILEWVAITSLPKLGIEPMSLMSPALTGRFFTTSATWEVLRTRESQLLSQCAHEITVPSPCAPGPLLHGKRSHHQEKPTHHSEEQPPLSTAREKPALQQRLSTAKNNK